MSSLRPFSPLHDAVAPNVSTAGRCFPNAVLWVTVAGAGAASMLVTILAQPVGYDPQLALLLRFMAVLKGAMAIGAVFAVRWRLSHPARPILQYALLAAAALMMASPGPIWSLSHVIAGAVLFHAGFALFLVAALAETGWLAKTPRSQT